MIYYLDASALVKVYSYEKGTEVMVSLLQSKLLFYSSVVIYSEVLFSLRRKLENREISRDNFYKQAQFFESHFQALINHVQLDVNIFDFLRNRVLHHFMRALDAIHLASALWLRENIDVNCKFLCSEKKLLELARKEGLDVLNPEEMV